MPEEIPYRMENEGLQKQAVVIALQSGFVLDEVQQGGILTLQRGVTGSARIANTSPVVECRAVPACCTVLLI